MTETLFLLALENLRNAVSERPWLLLLPVLVVVSWALRGRRRSGRPKRVRRTPKQIGDEGEAKVRAALDAAGLPHVHDALLRVGRGMTQVDHLVMLGGAIAVVETKAFSGPVYGQVGDARWTTYPGGAKTSVQNPLVQNAGHVEAVRRIVGGVAVVPIVVMTANPQFRKGRPDGVVLLKDMVRTFAPWRREDRSVEDAWARLVAAASANDTPAGREEHRLTVERRTGRAFDR